MKNKWKKLMFGVIFGFSVLAMVSCSAAQGTAALAGTGGGGSGTNGSAQAAQIPMVMQLAIGTFMLDKTQYPIDAGQAAALLPLWKMARSLSTSETAAIEEKNGLVQQIQSTMTADQLQAIKDLNLKMQDLSTISQEYGIDIGMPGPSGAALTGGTASQSSNQAAMPEFGGGGMPMDGGGPGGPPPGGSNTSSSGLSSSSSKAASSQRSFMGLSENLLDQIITFLEAKAQ